VSDLPGGDDGAPFELPLFPLKHVLFPDGLLLLKVFEARYLDLIGDCLRTQRPFGVVCLHAGAEVQLPRAAQGDDAVTFEPRGTLAEVTEVDAEQAGILRVRCLGGRRFACLGAPRRRADGLWLADVHRLPADEAVAPDAAQADAVRALGLAMQTLAAQGASPFAEPLRYDDAGWVANRWCEILPISLAARQKLMELADPQLRLQLVGDFLRSKGVIGSAE
jgi:Lon protease-like protein